MITIFDIVNDVISKKTGTIFQSSDDLKSYQPYMVNRWLSFYNPSIACYINIYCNKYNSVLDPLDYYQYQLIVIPKQPIKKIPYVKKISKQTYGQSDQDEIISFLSKSLELSKREVRYIVENDSEFDWSYYKQTICQHQKKSL